MNKTYLSLTMGLRNGSLNDASIQLDWDGSFMDSIGLDLTVEPKNSNLLIPQVLSQKKSSELTNEINSFSFQDDLSLGTSVVEWGRG